MKSRLLAAGVVLLLAVGGAALVYGKFFGDMLRASAQAMQGSVLARIRCSVIEYQAHGQGLPLLVIHGSGR